MLTNIKVENVAVIEKLELSVGEGLSVLTGETGAGKSIIIDSINMVLGERTSKDIIRTGCQKAKVDAMFFITDEVAKRLLVMGIEVADNELLVSREINLAGKSTARINGSVVSGSMLKEIGFLLVNIHGQHDSQSLLSSENHILFLDSFGATSAVDNEKYAQMFFELKQIKKEIDSLESSEAEKSRRIDMLNYQIDEIVSAKLILGEEQELTEQRDIMRNAEKITSCLAYAQAALFEGTNELPPAMDLIMRVMRDMANLSQLHPKLAEMHDSISRVHEEMAAFSNSAQDYLDDMSFDAEQQNAVELRLDAIHRLKRKYGDSIEKILDYCDGAQLELDQIMSGSKRLFELSQKFDIVKQDTMQLAKKISEQRIHNAKLLEKQLLEQLADLEMSKSRFLINVEQNVDNELTANGIDTVTFLFSANPGEDCKSLSKIASGGELSRVMLAIKTVLSGIDSVETLVFDEIDAGVSGRAAQKIAQKMHIVARGKQVLCITHLPQIAAMADTHYLIQKNTEDGSTKTTVAELSHSGRVEEIARIVGGVEITDITRQSAAEMLNLAHKVQQDTKI